MAMPFGIVVTRRSVAGAIVQPELGDGPPASAPNIPIISIDHEAHIVVIGAAFICPGSNGKKMDADKITIVYNIASVFGRGTCKDLQPTPDIFLSFLVCGLVPIPRS